MILILLGAPGAGKGTQAKALCDRYGLTHLSTGNIFRGEIAAKSALGQKAADFVKNGRLVPDNIVTEMVAGKLEPGGKYLLDGFPRNLDQAQSLDRMLQGHGAVDLVVLLSLSHAEALKRLTSRRVCSKCAEVYNVLTRPPRAEGVCDQCGGTVVQRDDDGEATANKRLMVFDDLTQPLTTYYKGEQVFEEVDAARDPDKVTASLCAVIDAKLAGAGKI